MHSALVLQSLDMPDIYQAPNALWLPRRKALHVTCFIEALPHAVDPAETKSFVQSLGVSDAFFAGRLLRKPNGQCSGAVVVLLGRLPECGGRSEELRFHRVGACPGSQAGRNFELANHWIGLTSEFSDWVMKGKSILLTSSLG